MQFTFYTSGFGHAAIIIPALFTPNCWWHKAQINRKNSSGSCTFDQHSAALKVDALISKGHCAKNDEMIVWCKHSFVQHGL